MRYLQFLFYCLACQVCHAQFFKPNASFSAESKFPVSQNFIREHRIKSVQLSKSIKEEGQRIRNSKNGMKFHFDSSGRLIQLNVLQAADSNTTFYFKMPKSLHVIRKFGPSEINASYLTTDSLGRLIQEIRCREFPLETFGDSIKPEFFKLGRQEILYRENYIYENLSAAQTRKKTINDAGIVYKEGILYTAPDGKLTEENNRFSVTGLSEVNKYNYTADGRIAEKIFFTDVSGEFEEKTTFTYDVNGNLQSEQFFRNGNLLREHIYFYDSKGVFPEAILTKYPDRKTIDMQSIQIEFY